MKILFNVIQIGLAVILCVLILLQARAGGLGAAFGGFSSIYRSKRGVEKFIYWLTVATAILFFTVALINFAFFS